MNIPEEFKQRMKWLLGSEYDEFIKSYDYNRSQAIRVNTLKIDIEDFLRICPFDLEGNVPWEPRGFYINEERPGKHPFHAAGLYYVQEPSAMAVAAALGIREGEKILDLCAAPGGKSTQAAAYINSKGLLVANEIEAKRARILSENIERMGIKNAVVTNNSPKELERYFEGYFDRIIVDAPCSGEGMFRKEDIAVSEWTPENVKGCSVRQMDILESAAKMLKPEGLLIYSTCTFSLEENEKVISSFLGRYSDFKIINIEKKFGFKEGFYKEAGEEYLSGAVRLFPHRLKGEGHFMCLLQRTDGEEGRQKYFKSNIRKEDLKDFEIFVKENLNIEIEGSLYLSSENLFSLPQGLPEIKGLRVVRPGLHIGTLKKNRFEPNHALALALKLDEVKNHISFSMDDKKIISYLKGDVINSEVKDGWCIVGVEGYSMGWGKASGNIIKNHYPKGLRW